MKEGLNFHESTPQSSIPTRFHDGNVKKMASSSSSLLIRSKKPNKREEQRRRVAYELATLDDAEVEAARSSLSEEEVTRYFGALCSKQLAFFGLVKLSRVNLNMRYPVHLISDQRWREELLRLGFADSTFLQLACLLKADAITSALLRAGADPLLEHENDSTRKFLVEKFPIRFSVWILFRVSEMYLSVGQEDRKHHNCVLCSKVDENVDDDHLTRRNGRRYLVRIRYPCCSAVCCESCVWERICRKRTLSYFDCPACGSVLDGAEGSTVTSSRQDGCDEMSSSFEGFFGSGPWEEQQVRQVRERQASSLQRWQSLPERPSTEAADASAIGSRSGSGRRPYRSKGNFRAMSMRELNASYLGETQVQRSAKLSCAAIEDLPHRIIALCRYGMFDRKK